jgi:hypothetical protein
VIAEPPPRKSTDAVDHASLLVEDSFEAGSSRSARILIDIVSLSSVGDCNTYRWEVARWRDVVVRRRRWKSSS